MANLLRNIQRTRPCLWYRTLRVINCMYVNVDDLNMTTSYINQWRKSRYLCRLKTTAVLVVHISLPEVLYLHWRCNSTSTPTWRDNNVVITSKRRHFDVITSKWRRFDVITTSLLRNVSAGHPHPHPHTPHTQAPPLKIQPQHGKVITYIMKCGMKLFIRFPNFNGYSIKVWEWISNFMIPHLTGQVITFQCWVKIKPC